MTRCKGILRSDPGTNGQETERPRACPQARAQDGHALKYVPAAGVPDDMLVREPWPGYARCATRCIAAPHRAGALMTANAWTRGRPASERGRALLGVPIASLDENACRGTSRWPARGDAASGRARARSRAPDQQRFCALPRCALVAMSCTRQCARVARSRLAPSRAGTMQQRSRPRDGGHLRNAIPDQSLRPLFAPLFLRLVFPSPAAPHRRSGSTPTTYFVSSRPSFVSVPRLATIFRRQLSPRSRSEQTGPCGSRSSSTPLARRRNP